VSARDGEMTLRERAVGLVLLLSLGLPALSGYGWLWLAVLSLGWPLLRHQRGLRDYYRKLDRLLVFDPPARSVERREVERAHTHTTLLAGAHQARRLEHGQVLAHRRQGHRQRLGQGTHRHRAAAQPLDHQPAAGVGDGGGAGAGKVADSAPAAAAPAAPSASAPAAAQAQAAPVEESLADLRRRKSSPVVRKIAEEHGIAIVENPPLARALYAGVELDEEVPPEHYQAVAEVISYVWNVQGRKMPKESGVAR